jgi:hypothetical protein
MDSIPDPSQPASEEKGSPDLSTPYAAAEAVRQLALKALADVDAPIERRRRRPLRHSQPRPVVEPELSGLGR